MSDSLSPTESRTRLSSKPLGSDTYRRCRALWCPKQPFTRVCRRLRVVVTEVAISYRCEEPAYKPVSVAAVAPVLCVPRPANIDAEAQAATRISLIDKPPVRFVTGFVPRPVVGQTCLPVRLLGDAALVEPLA